MLLWVSNVRRQQSLSSQLPWLLLGASVLTESEIITAHANSTSHRISAHRSLTFFLPRHNPGNHAPSKSKLRDNFCDLSTNVTSPTEAEERRAHFHDPTTRYRSRNVITHHTSARSPRANPGACYHWIQRIGACCRYAPGTLYWYHHHYSQI